MKKMALLRQCRDDLLALSDPDLFLLIHLWVELTEARRDDLAATIEEDIENQLCVHLGYTILCRQSRRRYPSLAALLEEEDISAVDYLLLPPTARELRTRLAAMPLAVFQGTVIRCALHAPHPYWVPGAASNQVAFLSWLAGAIKSGRALDRRRPQCLFFCLGFRLALLPGSPDPPTDEEALRSQLAQVWQNFVVQLLLRLPAFPETEDDLKALFLTWAAHGFRSGRDSLVQNPALEVILLLFKETHGLGLLATTPADRLAPAGSVYFERRLSLLLWERKSL